MITIQYISISGMVLVIPNNLSVDKCDGGCGASDIVHCSPDKKHHWFIAEPLQFMNGWLFPDPCNPCQSWWRHQMEIFSALLALCTGNSPVTGELPSHRPVTRNLDVFFDQRLNKQLSKQSKRRWFETPSHSLWRLYNGVGHWLRVFYGNGTAARISIMAWHCILPAVGTHMTASYTWRTIMSCSPVPLHFGTKWRSHVPPVYRRNRRKLIREPCHHLASLTLRALCRIK